MKVRDFAFTINNKKAKISGTTSSSGQVVYSKKINKSLNMKMKNIGDQIDFNTEVTSSACTSMQKFMVLGPTAWTLHTE